MNLVRYMHSSCYALGAALTLATTTALADASAPQLPVGETPVQLAVANETESMRAARNSTTPHIYASSEAGLRRAVAQGPDALRHYIFRTRTIYHYYFWDFAKIE